MKYFKLLLKEIKDEDSFGYQEKDAVKRGTVAFSFKGKTDDTDYNLKEGDEVMFQHGTPLKIDGGEYQLVSLTSLICQK